jgi:hypothetical protein
LAPLLADYYVTVILTVAAWLTASVVHLLLTARAVLQVLDRDGADPEERFFIVTLLGVATLSGVLHVTATLVGLSLTSGLVALALWHVVLGAATWAGRGGVRASIARESRRLEWTGLVGAAVLVAIGFTWIDQAAASARVEGPDALSYHVPYAVNLAHGLSPFSLPATQHLYPMAGSMMSAWFLIGLPGTFLLVDLPQALAFFLAAAGLIWLMRQLTGLPGFTWGAPLVLLVFSTPLFRVSSFGSADLWFAASFISVVAVLVRQWTRRTWRPVDWMSLGGALGLLVGSKTAGTPAAVLLLVSFGSAALLRHWIATRPARTGSWHRHLMPIACAVALAIAAGGIWLVKSWIQFGSPLAPTGVAFAGIQIFPGEPFERTPYLSVLGDWSAGNYDLASRSGFFLSRWLGGWFLPALLLIVAWTVDIAVAAARGRRTDAWSARLITGVLIGGAGGAFVWMLTGAPWTSLEWTGGLALRYVLPLAALLPLISFTAFLPLTWRWYDHSAWRLGAWCVWMTVGGVAFVRSLESSGPGLISVPGLDWRWALAAIAVVLVVRMGQSVSRRRWIAAAIAVVTGVLWSPALVSRNARALVDASDRQLSEMTALAGGAPPASAWREVYLRVRVFEQSNGRSCRRARFFTMARFDEPLSLQNDTVANDVFYAGRDETANRLAGPIGPCDYVVTTPAVAATDKGQGLVRALMGGQSSVEVAAAGRFLVVAAAPK